MKHLCLILLLLSTLGHTAKGQKAGAEEAAVSDYVAATVYGGLSYALPLGSYKRVYPQADAFGGTVGVLVNPWKGPSPLELGAQVSYLSQGNTLNNTSPGTFYSTLKTAHNLIPIHLVARAKPRYPRTFMPYLDGLAGVMVLHTRSKVKEDIFDFLQEEHEPLVLSRSNTALLSFGLGAGVLINAGNAKGVTADVRLTYLQGPFANYVQRGHVRVNQDGYPEYLFTRSETSLLMVQLLLCGLLKS